MWKTKEKLTVSRDSKDFIAQCHGSESPQAWHPYALADQLLKMKNAANGLHSGRGR